MKGDVSDANELDSLGQLPFNQKNSVKQGTAFLRKGPLNLLVF